MIQEDTANELKYMFHQNMLYGMLAIYNDNVIAKRPFTPSHYNSCIKHI